MISRFFRCKFSISKSSLICYFWRTARCISFISSIVTFFFVFFGCLSSFNGITSEMASSPWSGIAVSEPDTCTRSGTAGHRPLDSLVAFSSMTPLNSSSTSVLIVDYENWAACKYWHTKIKINTPINFSYAFVISWDYFKFFVWQS